MRIILIILEILSKLAAPVAAYFWARGQAKTEKLEDDLEQQKHDAQAWADAPRSMDDFTDRVRALAAKKRKDRT
jgi:hypothetical protein